MIKRVTGFTLFVLFISLTSASLACTDFQVKAKDSSVVIGRSMEFALGISSDIVTYPKVAKMTSMLPNGKKGISWAPKYGYLGIDAFKEKAALLDGINEAGLSVEFLWFTEAKYQESKDDNWIAVTDLGHWILGNFTTVDEVKKAITKIKVVGVNVPQLGGIPGFHAAVHDSKGNNIVIEFINGETKVYDNPLGVMTNKPTFDWQITNLRNYVNLEPYDVPDKKIGGVKINEAGSGSGWLGLPGDWTPPSRFVRTAMIVHSADEVKNAAGAVNLAEHILNAVDIPRGVIKTKGPVNKDMVDYTQWIVIKDLTNRALYFRSYDNLTLRKVDMKKLSFKPGSPTKTLSINSKNEVIDVTGKMM